MRCLYLVVALLLIGCPPSKRPDDSVTDDKARDREQCRFQAGALPKDTLSSSSPLGNAIPIDTIVIVMLENRSFDHMLNDVPGADTAPVDAQNLDVSGNPIKRHKLTELCFGDTNHEWSGSHDEYADGANSGFVIANAGNARDPSGSRAMGYYDRDQLPFLHSLATTFALGDRYFCSALGPTATNRAFLYSGSAHALIDGEIISDDVPTLFDELDAAGVTWADYHGSVPPIGIMLDSFLRHYDKDVTPPLSQFVVDAAAGKLPNVTFVDGSVQAASDSNSGHPPGDIQLADELLATLVNAAMHGTQWSRMALFVVFDEHGGLYDHVPPPPACLPDEKHPKIGEWKFDRLGFRVPFVIASPYAKAKYVSHQVYDHTSILRFIQARYALPALTARDANAEPPFDMFDFSSSPFAEPPALASPVVDEAGLRNCRALYPPPVTDGGSPDAAN